MATKTQIKNYIKDRVYTNTRQAITGDNLQETLCRVVDDLELGSSTGGVEKNYVDSQDQMTLDEAKKYTDAKVAGGGEALLTWRYSTVASKDAPLDPDKAPDLWHAAPQTADDHWAALKETGGSWNIWPLTAKDGTDGRGIKSSLVEYVLSDQGNNPPASGWLTTSPDIVEGKYLWSRTTTTYTDNTTSVVYTVTYIGRDGNDGKNGTSVNIKGTLASVNDLPTSPTPSENDSYIIGEDLWVYTGTSIENDKNHNGFTNVGRVSVKGDSACLHIAWANTLAPDYENFTTQKPKGQRYRYMGTYVDYSENPSTHPDSQRPEDYNWQEVIGEQGESAIVADLDNEIESIALTYDGKTTAAASYTPIASMWYGSQKLTLDSLTAVVTKTDFANNVVVVTNNVTGAISVSWQKGVELTSFNVDITVKATVNETQYVKLLFFKVNCVKAGEPGADAVLYKIEPSTSAIKKFGDGSISDFTISCKKIKVVGAKREETTDGILYYKIDWNNRKVYTGAIDTSTISKKIRFEFEVNNVLWDTEDIYVIEDGSTPKVVDTKYSYAITMNHVIPSSESWTEPAHLEDSTPIEGLPGQYLWTKVIYTWSDGTVTYSISYARCGFDGKNGKTKPSVATYKGVWKNDGLYTGTETDDSIIVDIVYFTSAGAVDGKYYMAIQTKKFVNESTPQPDTDEGKAYWSAFQGQYANIATDFLFSQQVVSNLIQAINVNATKINADKIDTNDLVARKVRTNDSGNLISIENNKISSISSDSTVLSINPSVDVESSIGPENDSTVTYDGNKAIISKTISTSSISIGSGDDVKLTTISRKAFNGYDKSIVAGDNKIKIHMDGATLTKLSIKFSIIAIGNSATALPITIASGYLETSSLYNGYIDIKSTGAKDIPLSYGDVFTIKASCTYTINKPNSNSTFISAHIANRGTVKIFDNDNMLIGKNGMRVGSNLGGQQVLMSVNNKSDDIFTISSESSPILSVGSAIKVNTDRRGLIELKNPMFYDLGENTSIDSVNMNNIYYCFQNGIPVYIKGLYIATFESGNRLIHYMARIEDKYSTNTATTSGECVFFATCGLHNMDRSSFSETTDYRLNIFISGSINPSRTDPFTTSAAVTIYQHTV